MDASPVTEPIDSGRLFRLNRLATMARLVAGLAHEINNSLQVVGGMVELLADRQDLPADVAVRLQRIGGQSDKAVAAVRGVLAYARETGPETRKVDIGSLVDQVLTLRRYQIGRSGITVTVDRAPKVAAEVRGDERQLAQAILNLVLNAEEALAGQPQRTLRLSVAAVGPMVQVQVEDSGGGVQPELRDRIFEPYFSTRTSERAVGLGLPVSRAIAESLGGRLWLADVTPGATFVLELPRAE